MQSTKHCILHGKIMYELQFTNPLQRISASSPFSLAEVDQNFERTVVSSNVARALAIELAPIRVNAVSPGIVDTPIYAAMAPDSKESMFKEVAASIPAGRIGKPDELAQTVLYLMSNGYTTGSTLYVDGGRTLR